MSAKVIQSVVVVIRDDHDLVIAFMDWALKNHIYSVREAGGGSGLGSMSAVYPAEHAAKITKFLRANKSRKVRS